MQRAGRHGARRLRLRCPQGRAGSATGDSVRSPISSARAAEKISHRPSAPCSGEQVAARRAPPRRRWSSTRRRKSRRRATARGSQRQSGPGGTHVVVAPDHRGQIEDAMRRVARAVRRTARSSWRPARDRPRPRYIAAASGSPKAAGRSSTTASGLPGTGGGRFAGRGMEEPGRSNTAGSTARVRDLARRPIGDAHDAMQLLARIGRQRRSRRPARARCGGATARTRRLRAPPTDPAARHRRGAAPRRGA